MNQRVIAVAVAVLASIVGLGLLLPTIDIAESPFSAYGSAEDDASLTVNGLRNEGFDVASVALGPAALTGVDPTRVDAFYITIGVDRGYTGPEVDRLMDFVEAGGTAIVLDDTGASDALLDRLGVDKGPRLFSTTGNQPSVVPVEISERLVNLWEPIELVPRDDADVTVLARADETTAKDTNRNDQIDAEEPTCAGGCAVAVRSDVGQGQIYVISDPTFATNKYASSAGAVPLVQKLAQDHTTGRRALFVVDESRHVAGPAEVGLTLFRLLLLPLGFPYVPFAVAGLVAAATVASGLGREDAAWAAHDPGLDAPYLPEQATEEAGSP